MFATVTVWQPNQTPSHMPIVNVLLQQTKSNLVHQQKLFTFRGLPQHLRQQLFMAVSCGMEHAKFVGNNSHHSTATQHVQMNAKPNARHTLETNNGMETTANVQENLALNMNP
jgi:hypothetical protein